MNNETSYRARIELVTSDDIKEFIKQCFSFISNHPSDVVVYKFDIYNVKFCYKKDKFKLEIVESKKSERTF